LSWIWTIFFSLTLTGAIYYFTKLKMKRWAFFCTEITSPPSHAYK
jgi:hypothetical protein